ncbi:MAG: anti-sigma factor [Actinomycetota bacterium]
MTLRCEEVREILPRYAEWGPRPAGEVEEHIATCADCAAELDSYRELTHSLAALRDVEENPAPGYLERTLALVPEERAAPWREMPERVVAAAKRRPAVASITGAAIGAAAIGLVVWRRGRKGLRGAALVPNLAPQ